MTTFDKLIDKVRHYLSPEKIKAVEDAYIFATKAHDGQIRKSGGPYLEHPLEVALTLADFQLDTGSLVAALLHDVPENCDISISEIEANFGAEIARLVDGTTKLEKLSHRVPGEIVEKSAARKEEQAENLRKMLLAMAEDLRVVFIKLADRLHNMKTLDALSVDKQKSISRETLEIYAPLAHRLGIGELKCQLEDLAFPYVEQKKYHQIVKLVATRSSQRESFMNQAIQILKYEFEQVDLKAEISGRTKHIYSIYQKMEKYAGLGKDFNDIHDLFAIRVLVNTVPDCYNALGIVHGLWHPLSDQFNDFLANPKANGYQSLHTTVMYQGVTPLEIQIRTYKMHRLSEFGVAAHWRYKEGEKSDLLFEDRVGWLRQLIEWHRELSGAEEFLESVKTDIFKDQVFVFTPKGEIKNLPKGSTPIDFAYLIHTNLGYRCVGSKVNGRLVPLNSQLNSGELVEIITTKVARGPSRDWLNPALGYAKTSHAREKIRQWFRKQERTENIKRGRELLEKALKQLDLDLVNLDQIVKTFKYNSLEDLYTAIGFGGITTHQIAMRLATQRQQPRIIESNPSKLLSAAIKVRGVGELLTHLALCCHPVPGNKIIGYITRGRGVVIHRQDCYNVNHEVEMERLISVEWGETDMLYPIEIQVQAWDRVGLVRDITTLVAEEKINIASFSFTNNNDQTTSTSFTLETKNLAQLTRILSKIDGVRGVISAARISNGSTAKATPQTNLATG
ncbi:RelA/SpoT family protein [Chloroflexota bacterium]